VGTAIVVTLLVLAGVGIVVNQLLRLRKWLKTSPTSGVPEHPDEPDTGIGPPAEQDDGPT
jgi:hypothetical protein